jgi:hypothetical protein
MLCKFQERLLGTPRSQRHAVLHHTMKDSDFSLNIRSGTIGVEGCTYVIKPSLLSPLWRYRALNASRRRRVRPSLPSRKDVGKSIQIGKDVAGAGPECCCSFDKSGIKNTAGGSDKFNILLCKQGSAMPIMLAKLPISWASTTSTERGGGGGGKFIPGRSHSGTTVSILST